MSNNKEYKTIKYERHEERVTGVSFYNGDKETFVKTQDIFSWCKERKEVCFKMFVTVRYEIFFENANSVTFYGNAGRMTAPNSQIIKWDKKTQRVSIPKFIYENNYQKREEYSN